MKKVDGFQYNIFSKEELKAIKEALQVEEQVVNLTNKEKKVRASARKKLKKELK